MLENLTKATQDAPATLGVSVALWRLRALMVGYQYALDHGYSTGVVVDETK